MGRAPARTGAPPQGTPQPLGPTDFVEATEAATRRYLADLLRRTGAAATPLPTGAALQAQDILGNGSVSRLLDDAASEAPSTAESPATDRDTGRQATEDAREKEEEDLLPDPDAPDPATPAEDMPRTDTTGPSGDAPPPHQAGTPPPSPGRSSGRPAFPGGGGAQSPAGGGGAAAVLQAANRTAAAMPGVPPAGAAPVRTSQGGPARRRPTRRQIAGPPPVPTVEPEFTVDPDPVGPATEAIDTIAARKLPEQTIPQVPPSPRGNSVPLPDHRISADDLRLITQGTEAMDRVGLSREGGTPLPGERQAGETRSRLLALNALLRGEEPPPPAPPVPPPSTQARGSRPAPVRAGRQPAATTQTPAEPVEPPPQIVVSAEPPAADMTKAEQQMFTAVIANLKARSRGLAEDLLRDVKEGMETYPGGVLARTDPRGLATLGRSFLPGLEGELDRRVDGVAEILGTAGAVLDQAVSDRRARILGEASDRTGAAQSDADFTLRTIESEAQLRLDDAAAARAAAAEARRQARAAGNAPDLGFRRTAEASVLRTRRKVEEGLARFELERTERHAALDAARGRWLSAVDLAARKDRFDVQIARNLPPGATLPPSASNSDQRAVLAAVNAARDWALAQKGFIDREIAGLKREIDGIAAANTGALQAAGAAAFRALRAWGESQDGAVEDWWRATRDDLETWAANATDTAQTWAGTEARLARLRMQRAAEAARRRIEMRILGDVTELAAYQTLGEGQRRDFIARTVRDDAGLSRLVGDPIHAALREAEKGRIEVLVENELLHLPKSEWRAQDVAARSRNARFDAFAKASAIEGAGYKKTGTAESTIFRELSGLSTLERLAVTGAYDIELRRHDGALSDDLEEEFSGDELRRARALIRGDQGEAAAEAVHDAVFGPGTAEPQIYSALEVLNRLPEPERTRALARADEVYRQRYGESLSSRLRGDLSGSERDRALALAAGQMTASEAHTMNQALADRDANAAATVYERINSEEYETAKREQLDPIEYQAAVARRNAAMEDQFQQHYANVTNYRWGSGSALENAIGYQFVWDEGSRDRLTALRAGDLVGVSAGRMQAERRGMYADDAVMGGVVIAQHDAAAAVVELERGPEMRAGDRRRLRAEVGRRETSGTPMDAVEIEDYRMGLERETTARMASASFDLAGRNVAALDDRLKHRYGITLDDMLTNTMSDNVFGDGGDLSNARARLAIMRSDAGRTGTADPRRLDWAYVRIRSGIEGAGTDIPDVRGGMTGLTQEELRQLDARWAQEHDGETLRNAIRGDTSGRDEDDLVDLFDHGTPQTVEEQVDELRRRLDRDEQSVGFVGAWASESESTTSHAQLEALEATVRRMRDPNLSPRERSDIALSFGEQRARVETAIETQRQRVDAFADIVTTVIGYVVAAIVIVVAAALTVASGGTLSPALAGAIAISGSIIGTISGMAAKAAIKGGAYGLEEVGTDIAVGVVDLAVTVATAGLLKGGALVRNAAAMMAGVREEVKAITRLAAREGMEAAGRQAARSTASTAAREGTKATLGHRLLGAGRQYAREQALDAATALPTVLTATVLDERTWREGNVAANVLRGTWERTLQNLRDGVLMGAGGGVVHRGLGAMTPHHALTPAQVHDRDIRHWLHANPGTSPGDFARFVENRAAANSDHGDILRAAQREARRSLLAEIPPRERGAVADVPILHVGEDQFRRFNRGNHGEAFVHVQNGQAVIIVRDGASASAVARLGPALRDIVAPGTRGRTVNPSDSLPPRLRNRVAVEVVRDPTFGADEVRAVPQRDRDGNITGVALQVGPNARAIDIQLHVGTLDAMRRYAGLSGKVRMFLNDIARRLGGDGIDPSDPGRWEAALEVAKLPAIIEERMSRLSERGLDPRRRALVMEEIASLERQFSSELARADTVSPGARGFVAAQPQGPAGHAPPPGPDAAVAVDAMAQKSRLRDMAGEIREKQARIAEIEQAIWDAQGGDHSTAQNRIRIYRAEYADAMRSLRDHMPAELHPLFDYLDTRHPYPPGVALNHSEIARHPAFAAALLKLDYRQRERVLRIGGYQEVIAELHRTRAELQSEARHAEQRIAALQQEYRDVGGDFFMDVALHPDLPERRAPPGYRPEYAFERKFRSLLGDEKGRKLMEAIMDRIEYGQSDDFAALLLDPEIAAAFGDKTLDKVFEQVVAHRQGYRAELALASKIAEGIDNLPGGGGHTVLDFGDPIGANEADVISIDAQGNIFLWDSKYRGEGSAAPHSETFTDPERRRNAAAEARRILYDPERVKGLDPAVLRKARENIDAGDYYLVTSHTNDVYNFSHSPPLRARNHTLQ